MLPPTHPHEKHGRRAFLLALFLLVAALLGTLYEWHMRDF